MYNNSTFNSHTFNNLGVFIEYKYSAFYPVPYQLHKLQKCTIHNLTYHNTILLWYFFVWGRFTF